MRDAFSFEFGTPVLLPFMYSGARGRFFFEALFLVFLENFSIYVSYDRDFLLLDRAMLGQHFLYSGHAHIFSRTFSRRS